MKIPQLTKEQKQYLGLGVIIAAGFSYSYVAYFLKPISGKIADLKSQIEAVEHKIEEADREAQSLPRLQKELETLQQQTEEANKRLPQNNSVADILVEVSRLAQKYDISLLSFTPAGSVARSFSGGAVGGKGGGSPSSTYQEIDYGVSIRGSFHHVGKFLAALALEERLFNVENANYSGPPDQNGALPVAFTLMVYQYKGG